MYLRMFTESFLADTYVKDGKSVNLFSTHGLTDRILESVFSLDALESKLVSYVNDPSASSIPFDASSIPKISRVQAAAEAARRSTLRSTAFLAYLLHRTKFTGNRWCPGQEGNNTNTTVVRSRDPVRLHSTTQGSPRVGDVWGSPRKFEASATDRERDGVPGHLRQTHLRGTHCIPGSWFLFCHWIILKTSIVQHLEHDTRYCPGTSCCCHATFRRV